MQQIISLPPELAELARKHAVEMTQMFTGHGKDSHEISQHLNMQLQQALAQPIYRDIVQRDRDAVLYVDAIMEACKQIPWFNAGSTNGQPCMYRCINTPSGPQPGQSFWAECPQSMRDQYGMDRFLVIGGDKTDLVLVIYTPVGLPSYVSAFLEKECDTEGDLEHYLDSLSSAGITKLSMHHIRAALAILKPGDGKEVYVAPENHITEVAMIGEPDKPRWSLTSYTRTT